MKHISQAWADASSVPAEGYTAVAGLCDRLLILPAGSSQDFHTIPQARVKEEADAIDLTALPLPCVKCGKRLFKAGAPCSHSTDHYVLAYLCPVVDCDG